MHRGYLTPVRTLQSLLTRPKTQHHAGKSPGLLIRIMSAPRITFVCLHLALARKHARTYHPPRQILDWDEETSEQPLIALPALANDRP